MTDSSSWIELRYSATQPLPDADGLRDELDGIALWSVDAVRCYHDQPEQVVAHGQVAVFDLESGLDLTATATAYGGPVRTAGELLLGPDGALLPDVGVGDVDKLVLFLKVVIGQAGKGLGFASAIAVGERLGSRRSLIGCFPEPTATNATSPEFFVDVPLDLQQRWWDRGLTYRGHNLWLLPPLRRRPVAAVASPVVDAVPVDAATALGGDRNY